MRMSRLCPIGLVNILITLMLSACATPIATPTPTGQPHRAAPTVTATPTTTATARAVIAPTTAPTAQACVIAATRTPAPSAPTRVPAGPSARTGQVDPHVEICASTQALKVGDTVTVIGVPVDIGLPYYDLAIKDSGMAEYAQIVQVTYDNKMKNWTGTSAVLEFVSAEGKMNRVVFVLRARAAGITQVRINATGEIHYGYPGPATWSGGGSESLAITVAGQ